MAWYVRTFLSDTVSHLNIVDRKGKKKEQKKIRMEEKNNNNNGNEK